MRARRRRVVRWRRNPGRFRPLTSHPSKKYLEGVKAHHDAITRYSHGTPLDIGKFGSWSKDGYSYRHTLLPFYHAGATPNEAAEMIIVERAGIDPLEWARRDGWHIDPMAAEHLARAIRETWGEPDPSRRTARTRDARVREHAERWARIVAERERYRLWEDEKRTAIARAQKFIREYEHARAAQARAAVAAEYARKVEAEREAERRERGQTAEWFAPTDYEQARRRASLLENPPRGAGRTLSLREVERLVPLAARRGVSAVARSERGFVAALRRAGSVARLSPYWKRRRAGFVARHTAQARMRGENVRDRQGRLTRRALALAMWAWAPPGRRS